MVFWNKDLLFSDIHPICYKISAQKEILKRHIQNKTTPHQFATERKSVPLDNIVYQTESKLIKKGKGIDPILQENKADNIRLAASTFNNLIIKPGEEFSFWKYVGKTTKRRGYKDGRVINGDKVEAGLGGGLCNLANTLHLLVLHSPLTVTEFHSHSDALAPDGEKRIPFATGTSVAYNYLDYRFKNETDQDFQLLVWCDDEKLYGELRSQKNLSTGYRLVEENHHFSQKNEKFYRYSQIYRETYDKDSNEIISKDLVLDNRSEVMFDYDLIPKDLIR